MTFVWCMAGGEGTIGRDKIFWIKFSLYALSKLVEMFLKVVKYKIYANSKIFQQMPDPFTS